MIGLKISEVDRLRIMEAYRQVPKQVNIAARAAVRRTVTHVKKEISVKTRKVYIVKASHVKAALTVEKPKGSSLMASVKAMGRTVPLSGFRVSFSRTKLPKPVRVKIKRTGSPKPVRGLFANDFPKSGYSGLMHRRQPSRYPLRTPAGPSVPQMVEKPEVFNSVERESESYLARRFLHEVEYRLARAPKGGN